MPDQPKDRASERLLRTLVRKQLEQVLDLLDSLDCAKQMDPGALLSVPTSNDSFQLDLRISRQAHQGVLPFDQTGEQQNPPKRSGVPAGPNGTPRLRRVHQMILSKASATEPRTAKELIRAAGYSDNSYAWEAITFLARAKLLLRTPDGYLLAS